MVDSVAQINPKLKYCQVYLFFSKSILIFKINFFQQPIQLRLDQLYQACMLNTSIQLPIYNVKANEFFRFLAILSPIGLLLSFSIASLELPSYLLLKQFDSIVSFYQQIYRVIDSIFPILSPIFFINRGSTYFILVVFSNYLPFLLFLLLATCYQLDLSQATDLNILIEHSMIDSIHINELYIQQQQIQCTEILKHYKLKLRISQKMSVYARLDSFICIIISAFIIDWSNSQFVDSFSTYYSGKATAMDVHYASNQVVFANQNRQLVHYPGVPGAAKITIPTTHKAQISTISISPDKTKVLSGGSDYTARVYNLATNAVLCYWDQLRGNIISSKIASDNDFYAFGSNQGYLYFGHISNCSKTTVNITDDIFRSIQILLSKNQIWIANSGSQLLSVNINTKVIVSYPLPTGKSIGVFDLTSVSLLGVCTEIAFYLVNYTGSIKLTTTYPTLFTKNCRMAGEWGGATGVFFLTATTLRTYYTISGVTYNPLWSIWKVDANNLKAFLYLQQKNKNINNTVKYGASGTVVRDAAAFFVSGSRIQVISIADGFSPYYNNYQDFLPTTGGGGGGGSIKCSTGFFSTSLAITCQKCNWDQTARPFCTSCNTVSNSCNGCQLYTYLSGSSCLPCPANCYACTSGSSCTVCFGGYTLISSQCLASNLTGCINSYWNSSYSVSQCYQCNEQYLSQLNLVCKPCTMIFANCSSCDSSQCYSCDPNFFLPVLVAPNNCQICSHAIEGCAACLNQTYCDTCYEWYPYFHNPTSTSRICKRECYFQCIDCEHMEYKTCKTCDNNRTLNAVTKVCECKPQFPINDSSLLQCKACIDYIANCKNCTSKTYCVECNTDWFFDNINSTHQNCKACNYTCQNCSVNWYTCSSCDANAFRILDPTTNRCVCQSMYYFQMPAQVPCQLCINHIDNCNICFNQTYCITCDSGYYIKKTGPGVFICDACQAPCTQCFGNATNCSDCYAGRQLNATTRTCDCLVGYYPTGTTTCEPCHPTLGSCALCTNDTICLQCWQNNYFVMVGAKRMCDLCKRTCFTCTNWTTQCGTCDPLANRVLNPITKQCDCITGFTETSGICLNCSATFQYCISCNSTTCFACQPGYSLAFGGLKCVDCAATYPGCINCLNGVCAACDLTQGYELSYSKCICQPGYYFKQLKCLPYAMGKYIQRQFEGYATFNQNFISGVIQISIYFRCEGIKMPYGLYSSVTVSINQNPITSYYVIQKNTTFTFMFMPPEDLSKAVIKIEFANKTLFDLDEYGPKQRVFTFQKNLFVDTKYELSVKYALIYEQMMIPAVRWIVTLFVLLACADFVLIIVFTVHILPGFILLSICPPTPLYTVLKSMVKINYKSLFVFADIDVKYEKYSSYSNLMETYGVEGGVVDRKIMDLVFMGCVLIFYGLILPKLTPWVPEGKIKRMWEYKFNLKRYSNVTNIVLCFLPSFQLCCMLDFRMQEYNPTSYFTIGISLLILAMSCVYIFVHSIALYNTQFNDQYKNEDCYFGSSILQPKSITFILSLLFLGVGSIPLFGLFEGVICLPILILITLWYLSHFRFWDNFPNKVLYFVKLFYGLFFLFILISFLIFSISQKFSPMQISSIALVGLISLVVTIILFSLACLQFIILIIAMIYKQCKQTTTNLIDNLEQEKDRQQQQQEEQSQSSSVYNLRVRMAAERAKQQEAFNAKLTNKQEHMKQFRQQHLQMTVGDQMYRGTSNGFNQNKTQESFRTTGMSNKKRK